ncbi:MAG: helix-hairpin-helix domain-containing protein [Synergistaceae bacterium]|nr:helix-hairpin-helix domain-containing protein [Synergistaceae bacterium]
MKWHESSGKFLSAAGILCFALAFVLLNSFKGEFGQDTAGISSVTPQMEDTIDVTPRVSAESPPAPKRIAAVEGSGGAEAGMWVVYVTGAVKNPGVYEVAPSSRVYEALKAAGGFSSGADQEAVNLASKLQDGAHIKFPRKGEKAAQSAAGQPPAQQAAQSLSAAGEKRININTAPQSELEKLKGVGPKTAQAIIEYRTKNGAFARIEDIMNVKGIGAKRFESMKDSISVGS